MDSTTKAAPMTADETMLFVQLVAACTAITSEATNATNNKLKDETWQTLADEFNAKISSFPRTISQLRLKWENLKKSARKRSANIRSNLNRTGGGKDYFPPNEILDKVASLLGSTCQGFSMEFGGDATTTPQQMGAAIVNVPDQGLSLITLIGYGLGVGDGDGGLKELSEREVLQDNIQILETPIPQQNNFFLNRASGSKTLAKRKHRMEEEKCKARIFRENALAEYLISKKKKIDNENEEKEIIIIAKLKLELDNARLENLKLRSDLNLLD